MLNKANDGYLQHGGDPSPRHLTPTPTPQRPETGRGHTCRERPP
jgi:hypothetical protein